MYAAVRLKGTVNIQHEVEETFNRMSLHRPNHCVLLQETDTNLGMLRKVKDHAAYGQVNIATVVLLLKKRGRLQGGERLTDDTVKKCGFESIEALAKSMVEGRALLKDTAQLCPVFRLRPPSGGHNTLKQHYPEGSLGDWDLRISQLLTRMA